MIRDAYTGNLALIKVIDYGVRKSTWRRGDYLPGKMHRNKLESFVICDRKPVKFLEDDNKLSLEDISCQEIKQSAEDLWGGKSEYTWIFLKISAMIEQTNNGSNLRELHTHLKRSAL